MSGILCQTGLTDLHMGNTEQCGIPRRRRAPWKQAARPPLTQLETWQQDPTSLFSVWVTSLPWTLKAGLGDPFPWEERISVVGQGPSPYFGLGKASQPHPTPSFLPTHLKGEASV